MFDSFDKGNEEDFDTFMQNNNFSINIEENFPSLTNNYPSYNSHYSMDGNKIDNNIYYIDLKENVNNAKENQEKTKKIIHFVSVKETPKILLKKEIFKIIKNKMHIREKIKKLLNKNHFGKMIL